ncbi:hypothetical protein BTE77_34450 [Ensifer adhaerens]|nr:hypothetical protein BTE77_34450 [Ensifer adhaerens]
MIFLMRLAILSLVGAAAILAESASAGKNRPGFEAAIAATPSIRQFSDWELVCPPPAHGARRGNRVAACRLSQVHAGNDGSAVFRFSVIMQDKTAVASITTPLNVYLPAGLSLSVDGGRPARALFEACNVSGCHAVFPLEGALLAQLKAGRAFKLTLHDTSVSEIKVTISLKGFTDGFDAL